MKKTITWIFLFCLLLFCLLFSGCGTEHQQSEVKLPYLTEEERSELEEGLVSSLCLEAIDRETNYYCRRAEMKNVSSYQLSDILIRYTLSGEQVYYLDGLPPHTEFRRSEGWYLGTGEAWRQKAEEMEYRYDISYTVGEFNYLIPDCQILPAPEEEKTLTVEVRTDQGTLTFQIPGLQELEVEGMVEGLQTATILSFSNGDRADSYHRFSEKTGCYSGLTLKIRGEKPDDDYRMVCRLFDSEGIIRSTDYLYYDNDGTAEIIMYDPLEPGHYVLEFEEIKWR